VEPRSLDKPYLSKRSIEPLRKIEKVFETSKLN